MLMAVLSCSSVLFSAREQADGPASRRVGAGFHGSGEVVLLAGTGRCRWSAGVRQGLQPLDRAGDHGCPGPVAG
ncbi:hypothetical protein, partial [Streptomyces sp. 7N604]|uniref:hypothetical protein n=1 Tax=Streptomyces sp. 7N604 TaxID=3457415 RepID=UPI003FD1AF54